MGIDQRMLQEFLSNSLGNVEVSSLERISPWYVVRCHLVSPTKAQPESVIVKWLREDPGGLRMNPLQMCTERAALEFLGDLAFNFAPRVLASYHDSSILVLEDLAPRIPLAAVIQGNDPGLAEEGLSAFALTMGELHASTSGHEDVYYAKRSELGPVDPAMEKLRFLGNNLSEAIEVAESLGAPLLPAAETEMDSVLLALAEPGPFAALSNGDAQANNFLVQKGDGRIIDFEFAGYRHALVDTACLYVPGPMWVTVSDPKETGLEAQYRSALAIGTPEANDNQLFDFGISAASMAVAVERLQRFPRVDKRERGDLARPQLVSTLESAATTAESRRVLSNLSGWVRNISELLRRRWPDADMDFDLVGQYAPRHVGWWREHGFGS